LLIYSRLELDCQPQCAQTRQSPDESESPRKHDKSHRAKVDIALQSTPNDTRDESIATIIPTPETPTQSLPRVKKRKKRKHLSPVPELGVSAAQSVLFLLGQALKAMIPLAGCPGLVLVYAVKNAKDREEEHADLAGKVDGVASEIPGGV
jgi:hypothetical protein